MRARVRSHGESLLCVYVCLSVRFGRESNQIDSGNFLCSEVDSDGDWLVYIVHTDRARTF